MPGTPATSPRFGAPRYANTDAADFSTDVNAVTDAFDVSAAIYSSGTLAARPAPTIPGRFYLATDDFTYGPAGSLYFSGTGSAWGVANPTVTSTPGSFSVGGPLSVGDIIGAGGDISAHNSDAFRTRIGNTSGNPSIAFGAALDTYISRPSVGLLQTSGALTVGGNLTAAQLISAAAAGAGALYLNVPGDTNPRFFVDHNGVMSWGPGNAGGDTLLYRSGVSLLRTDGNLVVGLGFTVIGAASVGTTLAVGGTLSHTGSNVGFFGASPATRPTVGGSRSGGVALSSLLTQLATLGLITDSTTA